MAFSSHAPEGRSRMLVRKSAGSAVMTGLATWRSYPNQPQTTRVGAPSPP
jgi:hypothetical protein